MHEDLVQLKAVLSADELLRRWPIISEADLAVMVKDNTLTGFLLVKAKQTPAGGMIYTCRPGEEPIEYGYQGKTVFDWGGLVFSLADVTRREKADPKLTWVPRGVEGTAPPVDKRDEAPAIQWVRCDALVDRWGWDIEDVVKVLGPQKGQLRYTQDDYYPPPLDPIGLMSTHVNAEELEDWEAKNQEKLAELSRGGQVDIPDEADHSGGEMDKMKEVIAQLKLENEKLLAENTELKAVKKKHAAIEQTTKATATKQEKTATEWAESLEKAVSLALECAQNGKPKSTKEHQTMWAKLWDEPEGSEPRREALRAFRRGLPESLKREKKVSTPHR